MAPGSSSIPREGTEPEHHRGALAFEREHHVIQARVCLAERFVSL
jgi:hypothetical protein